MKISINQSYFFPYVGYFQLIASSDLFVTYENVTYTKKSWVSRNRLLGKAVKPYYISVPVTRVSKGSLLHEVKLTDGAPQAISHLLRRVRNDYRNAAFFVETFTWLQKTLATAPLHGLHHFNTHCINETCAHLGISTQLSFAHNDLGWIEEQLRQGPSENKKWRTTERIRLISGHFGADTYVNLPGGRVLYDHQDFNEKGIKLEFLKMPELIYPQFTQPFTPHLSILDMLMHCGKERTFQFVTDFTLQAS